MVNAYEFLRTLAIVLGAAAVTTVVFQRLRQPVILGYILAGLLVGPHMPSPLVANRGLVQLLSQLGVILLMFSLGLQFRLQKLFKVGLAAGVTALIQCLLMLWLGFTAGRWFGWTSLESLFTGAMIAISSTTIITKEFDEQKIGGRVRELVVGVLIVQDLIAIVLMAGLSALAAGGFTAQTLLKSAGGLAAFLAGLVILGMLVVPRAARAILRLGRPETTVVASVGFCFGVALLALKFGYSVALGAFIAGSLVAESGEEKQVEPLILPLRDMFAAIFFVSVGLLIDPAEVARHWQAALTLTFLVMAGNLAGVATGAFLAGNSTRTAVQAGMSLAPIGEFSFIIAGLGVALGATGSFLYPVAVAVSALTTLATPWLIRASVPVAALVEEHLPAPLQTVTTLYATWVEGLRSAASQRRAGSRPRRLVRRLAFDTLVLAGLIVGAAVSLPPLSAFLGRSFSLMPGAARGLVVLAATALAAPFCIGIFRTAQALGASLAESALPREEGKADLAYAPRRAFVLTLQLGLFLLVGLPLAAVTQPFLPHFASLAALAVLLIVVGVLFWRSAADLQGHVKAGAEILVQAIASQSRKGKSRDEVFGEVMQYLPGLGDVFSIAIEPQDPAQGKTLSDLKLRALTGATALAILRKGSALQTPLSAEPLAAGDVLVLTGTKEADQAARQVLKRQSAPPGQA